MQNIIEKTIKSATTTIKRNTKTKESTTQTYKKAIIAGGNII